MTMVTAIALTRERERGTMEHLLAMPVMPIEVIIGKIIPYITIGYTQVTVILLMAHFVFKVPTSGNLGLLFLLCLPFIASNLAVGLTFSTLAKNQLQAMQSTLFFFLPSILLSGFMFPFLGMPTWAQWIGNILPLTHFVIIVRSVLLKNADFLELWPQLSGILLFMLAAITISVLRFKRTLD
jgi:ABC-2 type transport system permease protein